jgi:hypothetical protein
MPATVLQVADGIKARLATITGLRSFNYQPEQLNPPFGYPVLTSVDYHGAMSGGLVTMNWTVFVVVGRYTDRNAFATLDNYLSYSGAQSIRACLEADRTLGGVCQNLIISSSSNISSLEQDDAEFLTISSTLTVYA